MSFSKKGGWQRAQISTKKCYEIKKKRISTFLLKRGGKGRVRGRRGGGGAIFTKNTNFKSEIFNKKC